MKLEHDKEVRELTSEIERLKKRLGEVDAKSKIEMETMRKHFIEQMSKEKDLAVQDTKLKLWCRRCKLQATMTCCWNTNYCQLSCKTADFNRHSSECLNTKKRQLESEANAVITKKVRFN